MSWAEALAAALSDMRTPFVFSAISVALLYGGTLIFWSLRAGEAARSASEELAFEVAFQSGELELIGAYLRDYLGQVPLQAFLLDKVAGDRLDRCLRTLSSEVNQPEPEDVESLSLARSEPPARGTGRRSTADGGGQKTSADDTGAVQRAHQSLKEGNVWDAMALLRRALEQAIYKKSPDAPHPLQPGRFANRSMRGALGIFLRTANAAIHGKPIDSDQAASATRAAEYILANLDNPGFAKLQPDKRITAS